MNVEVKKENLALISLMLRLVMGSLFLGTALIKVKGGIDGNIAYFLSVFEKSIFPIFLVKAQASVIMFVEFALAIWLFLGVKLKYAWLASGLTLISLAFGMIFVYKFDVVSDNYIYVLITCLGLFISPYDTYRVKKM